MTEIGDGLGQREGGLLPLGEQIAGLFPGRDQRQALLALSLLARVVRVHVEAEGAPVELRGADLDQLASELVKREELDRRDIRVLIGASVHDTESSEKAASEKEAVGKITAAETLN